MKYSVPRNATGALASRNVGKFLCSIAGVVAAVRCGSRGVRSRVSFWVKLLDSTPQSALAPWEKEIACKTLELPFLYPVLHVCTRPVAFLVDIGYRRARSRGRTNLSSRVQCKSSYSSFQCLKSLRCEAFVFSSGPSGERAQPCWDLRLPEADAEAHE